MLIVFDSIENIIKDNFQILDNELKQFLEYVLEIKNVKVVISGKKTSPSVFSLNEDKVFSIKLSGLDEPDALYLLGESDLDANSSSMLELFELSRGYPESMDLFITACNVLKYVPLDLLREYSISSESFEEFIYKKIFNILPKENRDILYFLSVIRHPLKLTEFVKFGLFKDVEEGVEYLASVRAISKNNDYFYLKEFYKKIVYASVSSTEKVKFHKFLQTFYNNECDKSLEQRILGLSRKLLFSEQYHHHSILAKFKKRLSGESITSPMAPLKNANYGNKYDLTYLQSNLNDYLKVDNLPKNDVKVLSVPAKKPSSFKVPLSDFDIINSLLSDEEKHLLDDDEIISPEPDNYCQPNSNNKTEQSFQAVPALEKQTPEQLTETYLSSAKLFKNQGKYDLALKNYKKAFELIEEAKDYQSLAKYAVEIANLYNITDKYNQSIDYLTKALGLYTHLNEREQIVSILFKIAETYKYHYKHDLSLKYYNMLLNPKEKVDLKILLNSLIGVGEIYDYRRNFSQALKYFLNAFKLIEHTVNDEDKCRLCFKLALIYDDVNNMGKALEYYKKNIQISSDPEVNQYLASSYANIAIIYDESSDKSNAIHFYNRSLEVDKLLNNYEGQYKTLSMLVAIYRKLRKDEKVIESLKDEVLAAKLTKDEYCIAMSYLDMGDYFLSIKKYEKAVKYFIIAKRTIGNVISTDSKEKIDRRFKQVISEVGDKQFKAIIDRLRRKNE